jgi:acyl-CoA thioesterase-1
MENPMRAWLISAAFGLMVWGQAALADTVLVVGDSISAAFGLDSRQGWVSLLEKRLAEQGFEHRVVNASISGDTSAGGAARLPRLLAEHQPNLVIIELGGNDGLRGLPPAQLQQNLAAMVEASRDSGARVLLLGMLLPPNYGVRYTTAFAEVFSRLAEEQQVPLVPFFLDGVGGVPEMMQDDGIHPTAQAQPVLLENLWLTLKPLL